MKMERLACLSPLLLITALSACGGSGEDLDERLACIAPDDPRATDPASRERFEICPDIRGTAGSAGQQPPAGENTCPAADVRAWQVNIRYSGDVGSTSPNGRRQVVNDVTADLNALLPMERRNSASGQNWAPGGKVTLQSREFVEGELRITATGEGAPLPGDSSLVKDSRILLSIDTSDCSYNLYSSGTITAQITRDGETTSGRAGYGTVIIRKQPATLSISETRHIPVVEDPFDPRVEMPDVYIPGIGHASGVSVSWSIEPVEG